MPRKTAVAAPEEPEDDGQGIAHDEIYDPEASDKTVNIEPDPRTFVEVMVGDLIVDARVQRDANYQRVDFIRFHWDWLMAEVPTVAEMGDGKYRVIEAQHRVLALQKADPTILVMVAVVPPSVTETQQAKLGHNISKGRKLHNPLELWNQRLKVGEPHEVLTTQELRHRNLHLGKGNGPWTIRCAATVNAIVHGGGHTPEYGSKLMGDTCDVILAAFPKYDDQSSLNRWDDLIVRVLGDILNKHPEIERARLIAKLGTRPAKAWRLAAQAHVGPHSSFQQLRGFIMEAYNSGLRSGRLEP